MRTAPDTAPDTVLERSRWWGFGLFGAVAAVHVASIAFGFDAIEYPTKLALMPALAIAAMWALRGRPATPTATLLYLALAFSWLGDGAAFFFPFVGDELPAMLLCFGIAHLLYIALFMVAPRLRALPRWTLVYVVWWLAMIAILLPHLGALTIAVAAYGLVLGGTAAASARGGTTTALGGALFLVSDTILALRLFLPGVDAGLTGPWIMLTYAAGQGLLVYGIARHLRGSAR